MDKKEIKLANRKALPKFILVLIICMAVGWAVGYLSGRFRLDQLTDGIRSAGAFFGTYLAPWMIVALAVVLPAVCVPLCRSAKKLLGSWDGEAEDLSDAIERKNFCGNLDLKCIAGRFLFSHCGILFGRSCNF